MSKSELLQQKHQEILSVMVQFLGTLSSAGMGSTCISATHYMTAKCTSCIHFRMHMYAISTWLIILGCAYIVAYMYKSEMNMTCTFGSHGMGGGDMLASYKDFFLLEARKCYILQT